MSYFIFRFKVFSMLEETFIHSEERGGADKWIKVLMKKGGEKKMKAAPSSSLPVCLLKLFFHSTNALGVEKSV